MSKLEAALALTKRGLSVFPLRAYDPDVAEPDKAAKRPAIDAWPIAATTDESRVRQWWRNSPNANIGVYTGGMLALDVDPGKGGTDSIAMLRMVYGDLPRTFSVVTQSKGVHLYFALPPGVRVGNSQSDIAPGLDVRGDGGYVVGPGSSIADRKYAAVPGCEQIQPAPDWLIDLCKKAKPPKATTTLRLVEETPAALDAADHWIANAAPRPTEGKRNGAGYVVVAKMYDFGLEDNNAHDRLLGWNASHCTPPMGTDEVATIARSAAGGTQNPRGICSPDYCPFDAIEIEPRPNIPVIPARQSRGLFFLNVDEAADRSLTHNAEPLVEGMRDCGTMSIVYGESNSGKSFGEMDLDYHIALGLPWDGRAVKQGAVVWVAAEGGAGVYKRVAALRQKYGPAPFYVVPCPVNLLRADADVGPLVALVKDVAAIGVPVVKITLDTLSRVIAGGDENSSVDMGRLVHHFDAIREATAAHLSVIHHTGKDKAKGARGHSLLRAATDTEIEVADRTITVTKQRDLEGDTQIGFRLIPVRVGVDARGREVTSCYVETLKASNAKFGIPLTRTERQILDQLDKALSTTKTKDFDAQFVRENCRKIGPDENPMGMYGLSTIVGHLTGLSEKGWIEKPFENNYRRGHRVSSDQSQISDV